MILAFRVCGVYSLGGFDGLGNGFELVGCSVFWCLWCVYIGF